MAAVGLVQVAVQGHGEALYTLHPQRFPVQGTLEGLAPQDLVQVVFHQARNFTAKIGIFGFLFFLDILEFKNWFAL